MKALILLSALALTACGGGESSQPMPEPPISPPLTTEKNIVLRFQNGDTNCPTCGRNVNMQVIVYSSNLSAQEFEKTAASNEFKEKVKISGIMTYDLFVNGTFKSSGQINYGQFDTLCFRAWYIPAGEFVYTSYYNQPSFCQ